MQVAAAAVLAAIGCEVAALESSPGLAARARELGITIAEGPLEAGHKAGAPYDLILIDGAVEFIPDAIVKQLADGGRLGAALAATLGEARDASERFANEGNVAVEWERLWEIEPMPFDETLIGFCEAAIRETCGKSHVLPSGPLHDAAEMARTGIPTVMMFVQSLHGISHNKIEDTKEEHLELAIRAFDRLASKTMEWIASR